MRYPELPTSLLALEEDTLKLWRSEDLFHRTLEATADGEPFVFYEGPPTANGRPGLHHIISRTIKDLVCRYRTMTGRSVTRIAGWDTHGLPVEIEAEKRLGISGKPEIEALGIAEFNAACKESVFTYKEDWEGLSERIAYWLDYAHPYVTFHTTYVESVWWILAELARNGLMYRGYKSVPYCPRCGTALSSHEVAQGYADVEDPSLYFLAPLLDEDGGQDPEGRAFVVWTTTPWTVPSNAGLAVHPELTYAEVDHEGRGLIVASPLVERVFGEGARAKRTYAASELIGRRYARPLNLVPEPQHRGGGWTVVGEDFVSAEDGTGIVHMAPAFGSDDYAAGRRHDLPMLGPIDDTGSFVESIPVVGGMFVKDADPLVVQELDRAGNLFRLDTVVHSYPHCWRCDSPLIYMARESWFAATSTLKDEMLRLNAGIHWYPPEVGEGRMGEWLKGNVDWALSRERYWGTPLPVWLCDQDPDHVEWIGSLEQLEGRAGGLPEAFDPHRPFIDDVTWACQECTGTMRRSPVVVDVWFDSGAMPYAQWHYPFEHHDEFQRHFPADFICEGLDQTRGWFYSLLAISTMLGRGSPFRNVIVNDLILDAEGQKMSKTRGNAVDPWDAIAEHGADALRWYLITSSNPWVPKRYNPDGVAEASRKLFDTLFNTYRFFVLYANVEDWGPDDSDPEPMDRSILDRWVLSRLHRLVGEVGTELEGYQVTRAYRQVVDFLNEDLSNWYVRRSRSRFWGSADDEDARAAFRTLWECLRTAALLLAPVVPFSGDWIHRALTGESAHVTAFPEPRADLVDDDLEEEMAAVRALVTLGRAAREDVQIRVRQPLARLVAVLPGRPVREELLTLVEAELNVKSVEFLGRADDLVHLAARPNFRALGPTFGKATNRAAEAIRALSPQALAAFREGKPVVIAVDGTDHALEPEHLDVVEEARGGLVVKSEGGFTVALDPELTDELRAEGVARELVNRIQRLRKETGLEITDRIRLGVFGEPEIQSAAAAHGEFIAGETLAEAMEVGPTASDGFDATRAVDLDGRAAVIGISRHDP